MTPQEFEKVYEQCREGAIQRAMAARRLGRAVAEDAVQNAAIYCLKNLGRFRQITLSYFNQLVINNLKMIARSEAARTANRERGIGNWFDLADVEEMDANDRTGRTKPAPGADNIDNPHGSSGGRQ